jgi:hypothetical protein
MSSLFLSFFLLKKKQTRTCGTRRTIASRLSSFYRKSKSRRTKASAKIFMQKELHPETTSRSVRAYPRLRNTNILLLRIILCEDVREAFRMNNETYSLSRYFFSEKEKTLEMTSRISRQLLPLIISSIQTTIIFYYI